ncbi:MAG: sugar ABC transporter ATP-binding protein, partial [Oscillospiraceae bacterium]
MMVNRELSDYYTRDTFEKGESVLRVKNLNQTNVLHDISFDLKKGEILGFAGLVGAGRTELMQAIFGITKIDSGVVEVNGKPIKIKRPYDAINSGIALVPENRKEQGLILKNTVGFNMTIAVLKDFIKGINVNHKKELQIMETYKEKLSIKTPSFTQKASNLSGGNQQKVVVSKWLAANPSVLILDEPTRGIDVGAKSEMYSIMNELTKQGVSIIMVSSEMPEVMGMSDRICVMYNGAITAVIDKKDFTQKKILSYAIGGNG